MKTLNAPRGAGRFAAVLLVVAASLCLGLSAHAQDRPTQRQMRTYIPQDQLVSFLPSTPFDQFVDFLNPIFQRVTGKQIIDAETRKDPIGVSISGMHFFDALELVLDYNGLGYRETDRFFMVEEGRPGGLTIGADDRGTNSLGVSPTSPNAPKPALATLGTREIQISAVLFDLNQTRARELGIDWNVFFGSEQGGSQSGGGSGGGSDPGEQQDRPRFFLRTDRLFENLSDYLIAPEAIDISQLTQLFRLLESNGVGETIANPQVTVQSGQKGEIQIGSDIPVQTRDFAGNTITQFFSTGIIVNVTPTLISEAADDSVGAAKTDFIHLNVLVEKSSSRPSLSGPIIDKNTANTQVLLLDNEQTVIGGLYSTEETLSRRGIPILKDLPGWVFGLRYIFGYEQKSQSQRELLIVLQAKILEPLEARANKPLREDLVRRHQEDVQQRLVRFNPNSPLVRKGITLGADGKAPEPQK